MKTIILITLTLFLSACAPQAYNPSVTKTPTRDEYVISMQTIAFNYLKSFTILETLVGQVQTDPGLVYGISWKNKINQTAYDIKQNNKKMRDLTPPVEFQATHINAVQASLHFDASMDYLVKGVDTQDIDLLNRCTDELTLGGTFYANVLDSLSIQGDSSNGSSNS